MAATEPLPGDYGCPTRLFCGHFGADNRIYFVGFLDIVNALIGESKTDDVSAHILKAFFILGPRLT
jgi:hypothetical protein